MVLREWEFGISLGPYESVLDDSVLHYCVSTTGFNRKQVRQGLHEGNV